MTMKRFFRIFLATTVLPYINGGLITRRSTNGHRWSHHLMPVLNFYRLQPSYFIEPRLHGHGPFGSRMNLGDIKLLLTRDDGKQFDGEIVGAGGRLGSLLARNGGNGLYPVPKYDKPGLHSCVGKPIYVTTPASAISTIIAMTPACRWPDLVLVCNGIFSKIVQWKSSDQYGSEPTESNKESMSGTLNSNDKRCVGNMTLAVPHFGVLSVGAKPIGGGENSPPTVIYGKHAKTLGNLLYPIRYIQAHSVIEIEKYAARKLFWASIMWLLTNDEHPMTVDIVHEEKTELLNDLVKELLPVINVLAGGDIGPLNEVLKYLKSYSMSMPGAMPNRDLAIAEIKERNGQLLSVRNIRQPLHEKLVTKISGIPIEDIIVLTNKV